MDPRKKGARISKNFMISVSDAVRMVFLPAVDSFDCLEPVVDEAREIPFESLNTLSVRLISSLF